MPTSVRLDPDTEKLLERLARRSQQSKSEVIRDAIRAFADRATKDRRPQTLLELMGDLVGCVEGDGPDDLSERTGERFREILKEKADKQ